MELVLASGSPRRLELLGRLGLTPAVRPPHVDERPREHETAHDTAVRLAVDKATAEVRPGEVVLAADTIVAIGDEQLGKPSDTAHARAMLGRLSGRTHQVITGVAVVAGGQVVSSHATTDVRFRELADRDIEWYLSTGEGADKAGGYAIQGAGGVLVASIDGDPTTVIGLPLALVVELCDRVGVAILGHGGPSGP